jgi:hypothetical protein
MIMSLVWRDVKSYLHFWKKRISLPKVGPCVKLQHPYHSAARMLVQIIEHLLQRRTLLSLPFGDAAVLIGDGFERVGRTERPEKSEGYGQRGRGEASGLVEDVAGYGIFRRGCWKGRGGWRCN